MKLRNLLIPTDFSDQAITSLEYTLALARELQANVCVLYSYIIPINNIETDYVVDQAIWLEQARERANEEMNLLEERYLKSAGVPYQCLVRAGTTMENINQIVKENDIGLVVIGAYKTGQLDSFFGELYTYAIQHAKAPVLLIPENVTYVHPEKVVYATDLKPVDNEAPYKNLHSILAQLNPAVELLHVYKSGNELSTKKRDELDSLKMQLATLNLRVVMLEAEDAEEGILTYAEQQKADWLVAVSHHYGLLEGLFHSSHTKKLARQTDIPLLVSHE